MRSADGRWRVKAAVYALVGGAEACAQALEGACFNVYEWGYLIATVRTIEEVAALVPLAELQG